MNRRISILILLALSLVIYVGTSGWPPLLDSSDAGHAEAAREMLESHNWVILHIDGIRYLEKPPLQFWLVAASYAVFGATAFATRFPLALAVVGLVLMVYFFTRRWFGERAGFYAGLITCTSPGVFLFTRIMIPEAIYALFFTTAFYLFLRAWQGTISPHKGYWGASALIALAVLTRSLIGFVFPVGIIFCFLLATGGLEKWRRLPLISSAVVFLLVALPWHIAALFSGRGFFGGFFWFYFINEQIFRALGWRYPADYEAVPLWLWLAEHIVWFFPWIAFLPSGIREIPRLSDWRKKLAERGQALVFLVVWMLFIFLFFSWTKSRMEYYSFSAWPAVAILLGVGLERAESRAARWLPRVQAALASVGVLIAALLAAMLWVSRSIASTSDISSLMQNHPTSFYRVAMSDFMDLTPQSFADLRHQALTALLVILVGFVGAWVFRRQKRALAANMIIGCALGAFFFCANWALGVFTPRLSSEPLAKMILEYYRPGDKIALYGEYDAATTVGFYTKQQILIFNGRYNGLEFGSYYPDAPHIFLTDRTFWPVWNGSERVFLIVPGSEMGAAVARMPPTQTFVFVQMGDKTVYVNQRVRADEPSLAELKRRAAPAGAEY
jgi:4-amino-4-deoxy-L-arabinose transferase-like glycosyltransferase